eukprot:scaffold33483_cov40-Prasinocladus_malaysianus.AAC.1
MLRCPWRSIGASQPNRETGLTGPTLEEMKCWQCTGTLLITALDYLESIISIGEPQNSMALFTVLVLVF